MAGWGVGGIGSCAHGWYLSPLTPNPSPARGEGCSRASASPDTLLPLWEQVGFREAKARVRGASDARVSLRTSRLRHRRHIHIGGLENVSVRVLESPRIHEAQVLLVLHIGFSAGLARLFGDGVD